MPRVSAREGYIYSPGEAGACTLDSVGSLPQSGLPAGPLMRRYQVPSRRSCVLTPHGCCRLPAFSAPLVAVTVKADKIADADCQPSCGCWHRPSNPDGHWQWFNQLLALPPSSYADLKDIYAGLFYSWVT